MNGSTRVLSEKNRQAHLAEQFNEFYLQMTSGDLDQVGSYKIIEEIGEGAFGKVYLACHMILGVKVVLKCGLKDDPNIVREIYYHKQLKNRNIVNLYEVIRTEKYIWLVLEYCEGGELFYHIYHKKRLQFKECQNLFIQIVMAVKYVHSLNLSHRDLKLENILLADAKKTVVKLSDFGFVREFNPQSRKFLSTVCGTSVYMAPELLKQEKYLGFAIDIWALGVILYAMCYGQLPFEEDDDLKTKYKIIHEEPPYPEIIPPDLIELIKKMLSKDPNMRPSLNHILNSNFLIDLHTKYLARNKRVSDAESIVSIHQHYCNNRPPFQSKLERDLLKRLKKMNVNLEQLEFSMFNKEMNAMTGFYELLLKEEFSKKKQQHYREKKKKYREAKRSLIRSGKRVKSVLSLSDQSSYNSSYPIEKITSTLSLTSLRNNAITRYNDSRRSSLHDKRNSLILNQPQTTVEEESADNAELEQDREKDDNEVQDPVSLSPTLAETMVSGNPPANRLVAFGVSDTHSVSKVSTGQESSVSEKNKRKAKDGKLINKLQFWKKTKRNEENICFNDTSSTLRGRELTFSFQQSVETPLEINTGNTLDNPLEAKALVENQFVNGDEKGEQEHGELLQEPIQISNSPSHLTPKLNRQRPTSMISQISQLSQISNLSHMSTMPSESEFLDESDIMDEDYEYDVYESSIDNSHDTSKIVMGNKNTSPSAVSSLRTPSAKHPGYNRAQSSDMSIMTTSTGNTVTNKMKKFTLSQLSSNSSDDSSSSTPLILDSYRSDSIDYLKNIRRPTSPELATSKQWNNSVFSNTVNSPASKYPGFMTDNAPHQILRSSSPPVKPLKLNFSWKHDSNDKKNKQGSHDDKYTSNTKNTLYQPVITEEDELTP